MRKWIVFLGAVFALFLARGPLLEGGIFLFLRATMDASIFDALHYKKAYLEAGSIVLEGVEIEDQMGACFVERVLYHPRNGVTLVRPDVVFFEPARVSDLFFSLPVQVQEGHVHYADLVWHVDIAGDVMALACDKGPVATVIFHWDPNAACVVFEAVDVQLSMFFPEIASNSVFAKGQLWNTGAFSCDITCKEARVQSDLFELCAEKTQIEIAQTEMGLFVQGELQGGVLSCKEGRIENLSATYCAEGVLDPQLTISGECVAYEHRIPFSLGCRAQADVHRLDLYDLRLDTTEGSLSAHAVSMLYDESIDIYAPSLQFTHLSFLEPLVIESVEIQDFSGKWGDVLSYRGQGRLSFTHTWEGLSLDALGNMGVEASTLLPSLGELAFEVKDGRCFFKECFRLTNFDRNFVFEGFPFVDFLGHLHCDVRVVEEVGKQLLEPVIVSFRGSVRAPLCFIHP